jgi:hypothetical protein
VGLHPVAARIWARVAPSGRRKRTITPLISLAALAIGPLHRPAAEPIFWFAVIWHGSSGLGARADRRLAGASWSHHGWISCENSDNAVPTARRPTVLLAGRGDPPGRSSDRNNAGVGRVVQRIVRCGKGSDRYGNWAASKRTLIIDLDTSAKTMRAWGLRSTTSRGLSAVSRPFQLIPENLPLQRLEYLTVTARKSGRCEASECADTDIGLPLSGASGPQEMNHSCEPFAICAKAPPG